MTSIAFGGGPTLSQRRDFAALKDGSQVPGYRGYIPQLKYTVGKSYGADTLDLSKTYEHRHPILNPTEPVTKPPLRNELPKSTGDNKYTEKMVPGYTGYIPRWPFKFGGTYKEDCDVCIDEHLTNFKSRSATSYELNRSLRAQPRLHPTAYDPKVRDHLNTYRDTHPSQSTFIDNTRAPGEPPMPGYQGYMPRIHTTELGLGCRYHQMTKNGLAAFLAEQGQHKRLQSAPITIDRTPGHVNELGGKSYSKRLYVEDGMIPKYTGYLPQGRYSFGGTYGGITRSLEVCHHDEDCFGDYVKRNRLHRSVVQC